MAKQLIMDHTGDRQNSFDKDNPQALAFVRELRSALTRRGVVLEAF